MIETKDSLSTDMICDVDQNYVFVENWYNDRINAPFTVDQMAKWHSYEDRKTGELHSMLSESSHKKLKRNN